MGGEDGKGSQVYRELTKFRDSSMEKCEDIKAHEYSHAAGSYE